jgi:hypothetical protein
MDDPSHGVRATIIDLGLSRMDAGDNKGDIVTHWTPFEEETFMGEGKLLFYARMFCFNKAQAITSSTSTERCGNIMATLGKNFNPYPM